MMIDINQIITTLAKQRPIFHSEADFQHALAWEIQRQYPDVAIRLEYPTVISNNKAYLDIYIKCLNHIIAIELKYKTRKTSVTINSESFVLKDQSAKERD